MRSYATLAECQSRRADINSTALNGGRQGAGAVKKTRTAGLRDGITAPIHENPLHVQAGTILGFQPGLKTGTCHLVSPDRRGPLKLPTP